MTLAESVRAFVLTVAYELRVDRAVEWVARRVAQRSDPS